MRDDILRQAVLAIAISIDIKEEEYIKRVPAGTDVRQVEDPAFFVLSNELLARFRHAWVEGVSAERMGNGEGLPPLQHIYTSSRILSGLLHYVALELNWAIYRLPLELTTKMLESSYHVIVHRFIHEDQGDMLTELASRKCVYEAVRSHLIKNNVRTDSRNMSMLLHSNRPQIVFNMFKEYFREHSATAFRFEGSYIDFVMNAYQNYFYANHKADIWRAFSADDSAKREIELDQHSVRYLEQGGTPSDMYVHDHLINIREANVAVFSHSGHDRKVNGIMYDVFYLELCHLCELYAKKVNENLEGFCIEFKDPYSRLEGKGSNKGIGAKISNAKQCLPMMFDYIRAGNFNISRLPDFRRECFRLGRGDTQSTNPLWLSMGSNNSGESVRYIDTEDGVENYATFESIFKAVASTYNLMRALVERGRDLVEEYIKGRPDPAPDGTQLPFSDWFMKNSVCRYMDYLSSLDHLTLMRRLQAEADEAAPHKRIQTGDLNQDAPEDLGCGELLDFEHMVYEYAGSSENFGTQIVASQRYDFTHGLLNKPMLKGQGELSTDFKRKRSVYTYMTAIPYSYMEVDAKRRMEYEQWLEKERTQHSYHLVEFPRVKLDFRGTVDLDQKHLIFNRGMDHIDYAAGVYRGIRYNSILARNPGYAGQHVSTAVEKQAMESLDWHVGTNSYPCLMAMSADPAGPQNNGDSVLYNWLVHLFPHVPMISVCVASYSSVAPGDDIRRIYWQAIPLEHESSWIVDGKGYRSPAQMSFANDLHALALASRAFPDQQNLYVPVDKVLPNYARAKERLESSLGFALYIGIDNIDKSEIDSDVLSNIAVYQDYTSQVQLYRERLVELAWMQADFVQLLELMFTFSWFVTLPEVAAKPHEVQHAKGLFNSLLTRVFKKADLEWFFATLRGCYYEGDGGLKPRHMWPQRMVQFGVDKSPSARRDIINPRWAMTVRGCLESLIDDVGLAVPTTFEDGPYSQFMSKAQDWTDASERFIMLHGFLYEKTLHLKLLRDAYTLTFGFMPEGNNTMCCEINSVLKVMDVFDPSDPHWVQDVAVMSGMGDASSDFVRSQVLKDNRDFAVLLDALTGYYRECTENLRTLVNYDVAVDAELVSKFGQWHDALVMIPPITTSDILNQIRGQYVCDEHKYFYAGTDYFKADYGGDILYLHYSGHFLKASKDGQFTACVLYRDGDSSKTLNAYEDILKKVIANVRYSDYE